MVKSFNKESMKRYQIVYCLYTVTIFVYYFVSMHYTSWRELMEHEFVVYFYDFCVVTHYIIEIYSLALFVFLY